MRKWKVVGIVVEGDAINVGGINPWGLNWERVQSEYEQLPHPQYPTQIHRMGVYKVQSGGQSAVFAAGELSANVWGFYVPDIELSWSETVSSWLQLRKPRSN